MEEASDFKRDSTHQKNTQFNKRFYTTFPLTYAYVKCSMSFTVKDIVYMNLNDFFFFFKESGHTTVTFCPAVKEKKRIFPVLLSVTIVLVLVSQFGR